MRSISPLVVNGTKYPECFVAMFLSIALALMWLRDPFHPRRGVLMSNVTEVKESLQQNVSSLDVG